MKKIIIYTFCLISVVVSLTLLKDSQEMVLAQSVINHDVIRLFDEMPRMEACDILDLNEVIIEYDAGHQFSPESNHELESSIDSSNDFTTEPCRILDSDEVIILYNTEHHFILNSQQE